MQCNVHVNSFKIRSFRQQTFVMPTQVVVSAIRKTKTKTKHLF